MNFISHHWSFDETCQRRLPPSPEHPIHTKWHTNLWKQALRCRKSSWRECRNSYRNYVPTHAHPHAHAYTHIHVHSSMGKWKKEDTIETDGTKRLQTTMSSSSSTSLSSSCGQWERKRRLRHGSIAQSASRIQSECARELLPCSSRTCAPPPPPLYPATKLSSDGESWI